MRQPVRPVTQRRLALKDVEFGKTDARYEVVTRDLAAKEHFKDSFLQPTGLTVEEFKDGSRFYVYGSKGAGKTALLRYVQLEAEAAGCFTKFVTFATDIVEEQRIQLMKEAGIDVVKQDADPGASAINVWLLYIFKMLADLIEQEPRTFSTHRDTKNFCGLIRQFYEGEEETTLAWLTKMIKKGKFRVKAKHIDVKLQGELADKDRNVDIAYFVDCCLNLLKSLSWEGPRAIYLFFDELNLSFSSRSQHKRDAILIRDLILAIDRLNSYFITETKQIYLMAAARSEVLYALTVPTHEINKCLADRGRELRWFARVASEKPPIVSLVEKKIHASEKHKRKILTGNVFDIYFRRSIFGFTPQELIVELTWCNPRDIINLLGPASKCAENDLFDEKSIEKVLEDYSSKSWDEKVEELSVDFAPSEAQTLKRLLINCEIYFKKAEFDRIIEQRSKDDDAIRQFGKTRNTAKVLESLYRIGIIGQSTRRYREKIEGVRQYEEHWAYRGDTNFDPDAYMVMHRGIRKNLRKGTPFANR